MSTARIMLAAFCLSLSGCASFTAYVQQHAAGIAAFTAVAAAVSAGESAVINALELRDELKETKK